MEFEDKTFYDKDQSKGRTDREIDSSSRKLNSKRTSEIPF
jgi:hypothetical protein